MRWLIPGLILCLCGGAFAQGRYAPQGAAQRHFAEGERLQLAGDALRDKKDLKGARAKWAAAAEAFLEAKDTDPAYVDAYVRLGMVYYGMESPAKALPLLETGLRQARDSADLRFWYGQNLMAAGRATEGVQALERVAGETDRYPEVYAVLGTHYYGQKDYEKARPAYEQYLKLEPGATTARAKLGNTYFKLERYQDALATFEKVREEWPNNALILVNIGNSHFSLGQYDKAVERLEAALKLEPNRQSVHFNLAQSYFQLERYKEAVQYYQRYLLNEPESFNGNYFMGSALMELGADDQALVALRKAAQIKPRIAQPHYKVGLIELRRGNTDAADAALLEAAKAAPSDPWVRSARGTVARQRKDYPTARDLQAQAVKLAPDQGRLYANLAASELLGGAATAAEATIDKALKLDGDDPWTRQVGAAVLGARAKALAPAAPAEALKRLDQALKLAPKSAELLTSRALVRLALGDKAAAGVDADAAVTADPTLGAAHLAMGQVLLAQGQFAGAMAPLEKANQLAPNATVAAALAAALQQTDKLDEAEATYDAALEKWPDDTTLKAGRARIALHVAANLLPRSGFSPRAARNVALALAGESALSPVDVARVRYAALVLALRKGDGKSARVHLGALNRAASALRKDDDSERHLSKRAPPRHMDFLTAYTNMVLQHFDRAESLMADMRQARKPGTPEALLLRGVRERLGLAEFKKGNLKAAAKLLADAQRQGRSAQTTHNLAVVNWALGKKKPAEKAWRALEDNVPEATFNLAVALEAAGQHREAYTRYRKYGNGDGPSAATAKEAADLKQRIFGYGEAL